MHLHVAIPAFHSAVHQALLPRLRGRPVAVATDGGEQAPLFATSLEARAEGIWPGWRAQSARRRVPGLVVVTPDPDAYRRAQRALAELCAQATPRVGGRAGRLDLDLAGTERLWTRAWGTADPGAQAAAWAQDLRQRVDAQLRLRSCVGIAERVLVARLAARAARERREGILRVARGDEAAALAPWPLRWVGGLDEEARQRLDACGLATLGQVAAVGLDQVRAVLGEAAAPVEALLGGHDEPLVADLADPEPEVVAQQHLPGGADAVRGALVLARLAREVGYTLRQRGLACTRLRLEGVHLDGRIVGRVLRSPRQLHHDGAIAAAAAGLGVALQRRVAWQRLTLAASGLCAVEEQQELFGPPGGERIEAARDRLRSRFGSDLVAPLSHAG